MRKCSPKRHTVITYGVLANHNCLINLSPKSKWDFMVFDNAVLIQKKPISLYLSLEDFNFNFKEIEG